MKKGEISRLEEFWRNQENFGSGKRTIDGARTGFIIDWNVKDSFPLRGSFSILYDDGDYREYDAFYFRYIRGLLNTKNRWMNDSRVVKSSFRRYCENLFLGKLVNESPQVQKIKNFL
ncbi:hypothetical protein J4429_02645 [Candidatus Pacearchaeota archaeon]|nr:hypothetical protein [Candidatus Pacearchaeota archaeon]